MHVSNENFSWSTVNGISLVFVICEVIIIIIIIGGGGGSAHGSASAPNTSSDSPPNLPTLLRILLPVSSKWVNIGTMLTLSDGCLTAIKTRCGDASDNCLREMLKEWLQQTNPPPTKSALVNAVKVYNPSLAEEISALACENSPRVSEKRWVLTFCIIIILLYHKE